MVNPETSQILVLVIVAIAVGIIAYDYGKSKARVYYVPRSGYRAADLRQLIVKAKYVVKATNVKQVFDMILSALNHGMTHLSWTGELQGKTLEFTRVLGTPRGKLSKESNDVDKFFLKLAETRSGIPMDVLMVGSDVESGKIEFDVTVRPVLYRKITQLGLLECTDQQVQEAQHECVAFADALKGMMGAAVLEMPSVMSVRSTINVGKRLLVSGMPSQSDLLSQAEAKIATGQTEDGVKNCRSVAEQVLENLMKRVGLDPTDSFKHNLDRLASHKHIDPWMTESIYNFYYRFLSEATHDRFKPGPKEALYVLSVTESTIEFLLDRVG